MRADDEADGFGLVSAHAGARLGLIADSFRRLVGRDLVSGGPDLARSLWAAPLAIVAHGTEPEPVFFYGNQLALRLFETSAEALVRMPSRRSAEPAHRQDRARLLEAVTLRGFIDDYCGVRISAMGRRFQIEQATVWNLIDAPGRIQGQAAAFAHWTRLD